MKNGKLKIHESGCTRTEGYYKMDSKQKANLANKVIVKLLTVLISKVNMDRYQQNKFGGFNL